MFVVGLDHALRITAAIPSEPIAAVRFRSARYYGSFLRRKLAL